MCLAKREFPDGRGFQQIGVWLLTKPKTDGINITAGSNFSTEKEIVGWTEMLIESWEEVSQHHFCHFLSCGGILSGGILSQLLASCWYCVADVTVCWTILYTLQILLEFPSIQHCPFLNVPFMNNKPSRTITGPPITMTTDAVAPSNLFSFSIGPLKSSLPVGDGGGAGCLTFFIRNRFVRN